MKYLEIAGAFLIQSSIKMKKNKMKQPSDTAFTTEENSSNLERTNQYWYNPIIEKIIVQYIYTTNMGRRNAAVFADLNQPVSIRK